MPPTGLSRKWLFDHSTYQRTTRRQTPSPTSIDDGDLIKADRLAKNIRRTYADAEFVVWLCTNRHLDTDLMQTVYDKAAEFGIKVKFLEQSRLRDFLDVKPEGQWLRQEHLGIQADQMSCSLAERWFPSDAELLAELDRFEESDLRFQAGHFYHWWEKFAERGDPDGRAVQVLVTWFGRSPTIPRFCAVADVVCNYGRRTDLKVLQSICPAQVSPQAIQAILNALFSVKRRTLD